MRRMRRRRKTNYLLPFIGLIFVGVMIVFIYQIGQMLFVPQKGHAFFYIVDGGAKVMPFGTKEWETAYSGSKLLLGDSIKTDSDSRAVISFFDKTTLRMEENTEILLTDIVKRDDHEEITLALVSGNAWVNKPKIYDLKRSEFVINTGYAIYNVTGTVFDLSRLNDKESLKVVEGKIDMEVVERNESRVNKLSKISVGIGQEAKLDDVVMKEFYERREPSVLVELTEEFKNSNWFKWNKALDSANIDFFGGDVLTRLQNFESTVSELSNDDSLNTDNQATPEATNTTSENGVVAPSSDSEVISFSEDFRIDSPSGQNVKISSPTVISGIAPKTAKRVFVEQVLAGTTAVEKYPLRRFDVATGKWSYSLDEIYQNVKRGVNSYSFYYVDAAGKESSRVKI